MAHLLRLTHFMILLLFFACGRNSFFFSFLNEDGAGVGLAPPPQQEESTLPESFSTQVNETLLITGDKCLGGEIIQHGIEVQTCAPDQYIIGLNGIPHIGVLEVAPDSAGNVFDMIPVEQADEEEKALLGPWQVVVLQDGSATVVSEASL